MLQDWAHDNPATNHIGRELLYYIVLANIYMCQNPSQLPYYIYVAFIRRHM